ncbi:SubName: Full=Uncharacterized protein {ECO:0000313/EMBL:CCA75693.1} [Serendipita indica DSM 11827]|nr:SubName: Full=Uncharacterized protein {ECO:0000313/EMBL:CCA75693.1} [Serendipita indica DSM 11827]
MNALVNPTLQERMDNRRQTVNFGARGVVGDHGHYDRRASLPQRLNSTGSANRSLLQPSTESGHSVVSSMLYITSSQCASPSLGPMLLPEEARTSTKGHRVKLSIVAEEFEDGLAATLQDMALSEPVPDSGIIPREDLYTRTEHQQDAPMPYRRFAYDRDITPGEWSTLRDHVLALWNGEGDLTQTRNAEMETQTRVDEWNTHFFSSRCMHLVLFAGNVAKGGSLSGWKETRIKFKASNDWDLAPEEKSTVITASTDVSEANPSQVPSRSQSLPYALVMYDLQRSYLPRVLKDARASRSPGFLLPWMDSPPARRLLPERHYAIPSNLYGEVKPRGIPRSPSSLVPSSARGNAERMFYSFAPDKTRVRWKVDLDKALPDSGVAPGDHTLWPFLQSIFLSAFYQENHLEPRLGSQTGRQLATSTFLSTYNSMLGQNALAKLRMIDNPNNDQDVWNAVSLYTVLYRSQADSALKPCYYCLVCMLQFPRSGMDDMLGHVRKHLGHQPYLCSCSTCTSEYGSSRFHSEKALIRHQEEARRMAVNRHGFESGPVTYSTPTTYSIPTFEEELRNLG